MVGKLEIRRRRRLWHVATHAVAAVLRVKRTVAALALLAVESRIVPDRIGVGWVAGEAGEATGLETAALDQASGLEADI